MARMSHDLSDARYAFRSKVNLYMGRIDRRVKQNGEDYLVEKYNEVAARGGVWDHDAVAEAAWQYSLAIINNTQVEAGADDVTEAA